MANGCVNNIKFITVSWWKVGSEIQKENKFSTKHLAQKEPGMDSILSRKIWGWCKEFSLSHFRLIKVYLPSQESGGNKYGELVQIKNILSNKKLQEETIRSFKGSQINDFWQKIYDAETVSQLASLYKKMQT